MTRVCRCLDTLLLCCGVLLYAIVTKVFLKCCCNLLKGDQCGALLLNHAVGLYGKYSVNRSSYRPLVRVTTALVRMARASVRRTGYSSSSQVSEDGLSCGHHAVTNTKPPPAN